VTGPDLARRPLGTTGCEVSVLGFGAMELRGPLHHRPRPLDAGDAARLLHKVLDLGIDLIDTSLDYGQSEELIGRVLAGRRDDFFLASKCGCPVGPPGPGLPHGPGAHDFSAANVVAGVHESLRRLRTDRLDLVQLHMSPARAVLEQERTLEALDGLRQAGAIRFIGSSSTLPNVEDLLTMESFDVFQLPYSAMQRDHESIIDDAARAGAGVIVRGAVAQAGKSSPAAGGDWGAWSAAGLDELAEGMTRTQFMLRFTLAHPGLSTALVGTADERHLTENVDAARRGPLEPDVLLEARRRLDALRSAPPSRES
jgi:aryl-alcohol dehydrogenase-like predicted oxidoreductase